MRSVLLASLTVLIGGAAQAGPLPTWSYSTSFAGDGGHSYLKVGNNSRPEDPIYEPDGYRHGTFYAAVSPVAAAGVQRGDARVAVGTAQRFPDNYWLSGGNDEWAVDPSQYDQAFRAGLTVVDQLSGESATFTATGRGDTTGDEATLRTTLEVYDGLTGEAVLGGRRYSVAWGKVNPEYMVSAGDAPPLIVADVSVLPATVPEPATLSLAGLGLAAVWRRRAASILLAPTRHVR